MNPAVVDGIARGSDLGPYRVEALQRSGAGGAVFLADDHDLGRTVALLVPSAPPGSSAATAFAEDARALARVSHPNLLPVYEVSESDRGPVAVMRDAKGDRLDELLRTGPLSSSRAVEIVAQVAGALEALRAAGVEPVDLDTSSVIVGGEPSRDHVYVSLLEPTVDSAAGGSVLRPAAADGDHAVASLAALLKATEGEGHTDDVIERALSPGGYESTSAFVAAARAAARPAETAARRSRRPMEVVLATLAAIVIAAAVGVMLFVRGNGDDESAAPRPSSSSAPAGRLAATIPLGADPGSIAIGEDAVWVATVDGTVLRVDPSTNEVVGAPIRFAEARKNENVTLRAGEGAIWALDGSGGTLTRIDPVTARITGRLRLGGILHGAAVGLGSVWISRAPPGAGPRQPGELIRVDADSFRRVGRAIPIGAGAADVEIGDGFVWTMNGSDGTLTRYDVQSGSRRTIQASAQPLSAVLREDVLWIADPVSGAVIPLDADGQKPPGSVVRGTGHPFSVEATEDAVWVAAVAQPSPTASARLYRVDPTSRSLSGRPVELGPAVGWVSRGFGALWIYSHSKRALLKAVPTSPAPSPNPSQPAVGGTPLLESGPLPPGRWRAPDFAVPATLDVSGRGWVSLGRLPGILPFVRFDSPSTSVEVVAPKQLFTANGGVRRLTTPAQIIDALESNKNVTVGPRERISIGGIPAIRVTVEVRPYGPFPDFCPTPCVPIFPVELGTVAVGSRSKERLSIVEAGGAIIVVHENAPRTGRGFAETESLVRGLRFKPRAE